MKKIILIAIGVGLLATACTSQNVQNTQDYKLCKDAGMEAANTIDGGILCVSPSK